MSHKLSHCTLVDGQMVQWYENGTRYGRLMAIDNQEKASVLVKRHWPPRPFIIRIAAARLEPA